MNRIPLPSRLSRFIFAAILVLSASGFWQGSAAPILPVPQTDPVTTITVDSTTDPDTSDSRTCLTHTPCTLRRAVIQARNLATGQKPALIAFNIPTSDPGYDATLQIWKIEFSGISSAANAALRYLNGNIIIDGSTQPGGRVDGPKIILVGPGSGQNDGIKLGETSTQNANEIRGLGFQNFKDHLIVNSDGNIIEQNWFGLSDDGSEPYLRNDLPQDGSGSSGVAVSSGTANNLIQENIFLGFDGVAAAIRGEANSFTGNTVGLAADGSAPGKETDPSLVCTPVDWLGGGGISVEGAVPNGGFHLIENNRFAGLRQEISATATQPDAIRVSGTNHLIQSNEIGIDGNGEKIGVCGRGIYLIGSPHDMEVRENVIVNPGLSGISLNDVLYDAVLLRGNTIEQDTPWGQVDGNPTPESAIQVGVSLPDPLELFRPARVTAIAGLEISGEADSPCANCVIEIFLDDSDTITEALQSLAVTTADASGDWTATLPFELQPGDGLRTTSTTMQYNTIAGISAGTTSGLSKLFTAEFVIYLPMVRR